MRHLPHSARIARPWKNGGGVTRDVFTAPEGAGLDSFDWRVSLAEVASDGPFSRFDGIDRTTAILSGAGFFLTVDGHPHRLTPDSPGLAYPGDAPASAVLIGGPVIDLNVMTRRARHSHSLRRVVLDQPAVFEAGTALVLWQAGRARVSNGATPVMPDPLDALVFDDAAHPACWRVEPDGPIAFWLVRILPTR